jgi:hypothetical protein
VIVQGRVTNPTSHSLVVAPIRALARDSEGFLVQAREIPAPVHSLEPGASAAFSSSEPNAPPSGATLTLTLDAQEDHALQLD